MSPMLTEWAKLLLCDLVNEQVQPVYVELSDQLAQGLKCICDAAFYAVPLLSELSVSTVVFRWVLWLKRWSADQMSTKALPILPFQGESLFDFQIRMGHLTRASLFLVATVSCPSDREDVSSSQLGGDHHGCQPGR